MSLMDIYARIKKDHEKHRDLLDKLVKTSGETEERKQLFTALLTDVKSHANAEEQTFYSLLIEKNEGQEKARHSISEHKEANDLFDELEQMDMSNPHWLPKFKELKKELEHHMDEEEDEVFALAKKIIPHDKAEEIATKFSRRKEQELKEME